MSKIRVSHCCLPLVCRLFHRVYIQILSRKPLLLPILPPPTQSRSGGVLPEGSEKIHNQEDRLRGRHENTLHQRSVGTSWCLVERWAEYVFLDMTENFRCHSFLTSKCLFYFVCVCVLILWYFQHGLNCQNLGFIYLIYLLIFSVDISTEGCVTLKLIIWECFDTKYFC